MKREAAVRIELDPACHVPEVVIRTEERTAFIDDIISAIERCASDACPKITAYRGDVLCRLSQREVFRVYTQARRLIVSTRSGDYEARCPLRELEEKLDAETFVRISRFEIVNIDRIASFDLSVSGTIKVIFEDGSSTWVARRYVRAIEQKLRSAEGGTGRE